MHHTFFENIVDLVVEFFSRILSFIYPLFTNPFTTPLISKQLKHSFSILVTVSCFNSLDYTSIPHTPTLWRTHFFYVSLYLLYLSWSIILSSANKWLCKCNSFILSPKNLSILLQKERKLYAEICEVADGKLGKI